MTQILIVEDSPTQAAHLAAILREENIAAEDAALKLLADCARGSMRDALSLLDQALAVGDGRIDAEQVRSAFGGAPFEQRLAVLEAAAVGMPDAQYGQEIMACVVLKPGEYCSLEELYSFSQQELGRYKTPKLIRFVDSLPKGPSGKVQRLKLLEA